TDVAAFFAPLWDGAPDNDLDSYFGSFGQKLPFASRVGWSAEHPAQLLCDGGEYSWPLRDQSGTDEDAIVFPRRFAMNDAGTQAAEPAELAERADGAPSWGVLRGDVDQFGVRLRHSSSIEEHIHLSVLFKEFFSGELSVLCTLPEFWRKVSIVYRGGDDFGLAGSWDALIAIGREMHRLFDKFAEQNLQSQAGIEAKSITTALTLAPDGDAPIAAVFEQAEVELRNAKAAEPGTFRLFGRSIDWKRLADAEELKTSLVRLVRDLGFAPDSIHDLVSVYRESFSARATRRGKSARADKPWRTYMRISQVIPEPHKKETAVLRNTVINHLLGKKTAGMKLRPAARIGLEWARLAAGS
ncbi:MAG: hypothetical protein JOZ62_11045, partial [Acidobacteriaceae bacterium]|nr:hypothetical protein [Acidobacteriaceae bacterium]